MELCPSACIETPKFLLLLVVVVYSCLFWDGPHSLTLNSQCVPHWPQTHDPLAFVFWGLGLQSCTITSGWNTDYNMTAFGKRAFKGVKCSLQCRALIYQEFCHSRNIKRNQRALWVCAWMNTEKGPREDLWAGSDHKKIKQQPCQKPTLLALRFWTPDLRTMRKYVSIIEATVCGILLMAAWADYYTGHGFALSHSINTLNCLSVVSCLHSVSNFLLGWSSR